ncbi:MAG TPA: aquaporin, partial [Acidimicrobiales bacterium]|nr:aquaporin [Acidimicrobiales bacterium]
MRARPLFAEFLGTAILVFIAVGVATLSFGFKFTGLSVAAGVVATALSFGFVLAALVYAIGPISGCHVNPAVTIGFWVSGKLTTLEAVAYWVVQVAGGIAGAALLYGVFNLSGRYRHRFGLGTNGYGVHSLIRINASGAFLVEVVITFLFVFVILATTRHARNAAVAGVAIGITLTLVHLFAIPIDGTSVNPARSIGPALIIGGDAVR